MNKRTWISVFLLVVFCLSFVKVQSLIIADRHGRRVEEKVLMLSDRPEVTKILSLGHDSTVADLLWIRAIQYFGGNFSSLNKPEKKPGMVNLFRNMVSLDPHFSAAYQFGGFVLNESVKDPDLAISFMLEGADHNPKVWRLRFDAGFIAFYQLQDYDIAKRLFDQTVYGENLALHADIQTEGLVDGFDAQVLQDDDTHGEVKFHPQTGSITLDLGTSQTLGRITVLQNTLAQQSFRLSYSNDAGDIAGVAFQEIAHVTQTGSSELSSIEARAVRLDGLQTAADGFFAITEIGLNGPRNPDVPSYIDRMAIEMDRAAGRFRVAWDQYRRYYIEQKEKGDEISAALTVQKLDDIYNGKVGELLDEAIRLYLEQEGSLPSPHMKELVEGGFVQRVLQEKMLEDDQFQSDVLPVLLGENQNVYNMLMTWDMSSPIIMVPVGDEETKDWNIVSRTLLVNRQKSSIEVLQKLVDQYQEETGKFPAQWDDLKENRLFNAPSDIFQDPLGGEFILNPQTGKVEARDPIY